MTRLEYRRLRRAVMILQLYKQTPAEDRERLFGTEGLDYIVTTIDELTLLAEAAVTE